ncbi:MAG: hypothetical protein ACD_75C01164G0001, partial [uncultured bacterium]
MLDSALEAQAASGEMLGDILIKNMVVDELDVLQALGHQYGMEVRKSLPADIKTDFTERVSISFLKQHKLVPIVTAEEQFIAINDPCVFQPLDDLREIMTPLNFDTVLAPSQHILNA